MPELARILDYFAGAFDLMRGRTEGLKRLDISADGFWESFAAIPVALPALALSWIEFRQVEEVVEPGMPRDPVLIYGAHALADLLGWILPVVILMVIARRIGFSRKVVPLIIAANWGGALIAWGFVPYWLMLLAFGAGAGASLVGLVLSIGSIALTVRLVSTALGRDVAAATAVVALMVVASLISYGAVMDVTGVRLL
ncbi:hypothetical protein [Antarcticirhabdus aurantiaca]|uniref:Uncharacterized protein n=1 Tax=Antarcticirhabdus aurantiaca TaxID=2606717 RepID=A0ACD4NJR5_9HYPH|nr:hypothetical protein [Antarcticirhabdus aurantiaca]WAJ27002.1 hypothetical protein OXU80_19340 [Jeongeuplla avenae]